MIPIHPQAPAAAGPRSPEGFAEATNTLTADERVARYLRPGTLQLQGTPPLAVYIHLPWCLKKCPYCDFNSHAQGDPQVAPAQQQRYLEALLADLHASLPMVWGRRVHSVFIGGGTPSLFAPEHIDTLLQTLRALLPLNPGCEITLEANPGTFERARFRAFRAAGVTRLSIGVQSFHDDHLKALGRVHDRVQALAAAEEAVRTFERVNLDLMYALPGQTLAQSQDDLATALSLGVTHLSLYHLTLEPNTAFALNPPPLPDEDTAFDMLDGLIATTGQQGFERYEVSAYAARGHRSVHNLNYWQFGDYLGLGAGAHSKLSYPHRIMRQVRWREPQMYMDRALAGQALSNDVEVSRRELPFEFMLNALRLREGVELALYCERTGMPVSSIEAGLARGRAQGLLEPALDRIQASAKGFDFLNDLQGLFLPPDA